MILRSRTRWVVVLVLAVAQPVVSTSALRAQAMTKRFGVARDTSPGLAAAHNPAALLKAPAVIPSSRDIGTTDTTLVVQDARLFYSTADSDAWKTARITAYTLGAVAVGVLVFALIAIHAD